MGVQTYSAEIYPEKMKTELEKTKSLYYFSILLVVAGGIASLFYYSFLMPLHVDESGFWFHYTNRSFQHRFIFNPLNPNHTLTIYLAKISLGIFGNTGIGLRFPVVVFGILSAGILYLFVNKVTGSKTTGALASALLLLNPFFLHYSHELRGYPAYFVFLVASYLCLIHLLKKGNKFSIWALLFLFFVVCYVANLAAPIFFTIFLASIWIFVVLNKFTSLGNRISEFEKINIRSFFFFSAIAASFFAFVMFYLDRAVMPNLFKVQNPVSNYLAIPDIFSVFLGYKYLDDATSILYSYPTLIWLLSLSSFIYGWWRFMKEKHWLASLFLLMFVLNSIFYIALQTWIPVRSSIYLLPFILLFQACGLKAIIEKGVNKLNPQLEGGVVYRVLAVVLICYFALLNIGKYRNFEPESGNPFELALTFLKENTGPNDLIVSSLYDTQAGFYFGDLIRGKNFNIYENGKIENIYYLTPKMNEKNIKMDSVIPTVKKVNTLFLDKFENVVSYENNGVRPSAVHIFKKKIEIQPILDLNKNNLPSTAYFGNNQKACNLQKDGNGIRISCESSSFTCARQALDSPKIKKDDFQLVMFRHKNDKGTKTISFASFKSIDPMGKQPFNPFPDINMVNLLVNNIKDLDIHGENIDLIDVSLQNMGGGNNAMFCMQGRLFNGNSIIHGVKVFNWKYSGI